MNAEQKREIRRLESELDRVDTIREDLKRQHREKMDQLDKREKELRRRLDEVLHEAKEDESEDEENEGQAEYEVTDAAVDLAVEHGIELDDIEGTGKDGRIIKADVEAVIEE